MVNIKDAVDAATSENVVGEDWSTILDICDMVDVAGTTGARECVLAIAKRLPHRNPNVVLRALSLTEALVKNTGRDVQREIASRPFTEVLVKVLQAPDTNGRVKQKIVSLIAHCTDAYASDPLLGYMRDVRDRLVRQGVVFPTNEPSPAPASARSGGGGKKKPAADDAEAARRKEAEDLELAIALSLSEAEQQHSVPHHARRAGSTVSSSGGGPRSPFGPPPTLPMPSQPQPLFHVRANYDFAGADRGELGFHAGDVLGVVDADYDDWWEAELRGVRGMIPAAYVSRLGGEGAPPVSSAPSQVSVQPTGGSVATTLSGGPTLPTASELASVPTDVLLTKHVLPLVDELMSLLSSGAHPLDHAGVQAAHARLVAIRPVVAARLAAAAAQRDKMLALNDALARARATYDRLMDAVVKGATAGAPPGWGAPPQQQQQQGYAPGYMPPQYGPPGGGPAPPAMGPPGGGGGPASYSPAPPPPGVGAYPPPPQQQQQQQQQQHGSPGPAAGSGGSPPYGGVYQPTGSPSPPQPQPQYPAPTGSSVGSVGPGHTSEWGPPPSHQQQQQQQYPPQAQPQQQQYQQPPPPPNWGGPGYPPAAGGPPPPPQQQQPPQGYPMR